MAVTGDSTLFYKVECFSGSTDIKRKTKNKKEHKTDLQLLLGTPHFPGGSEWGFS